MTLWSYTILTDAANKTSTVSEPSRRTRCTAITRPEADRAALIGRLSSRDDAQWLAEILIDLETDEVARLQVVEGLRIVLAAG